MKKEKSGGKEHEEKISNYYDDYTMIIQTYVLTMGLAQGRYSFATAIGLLQSVLSLILIYTSNYITNKLSGVGLF